jgi:hypothetical protein
MDIKYRPQMEPPQLGPIDRACICVHTPTTALKWYIKPRKPKTNNESPDGRRLRIALSIGTNCRRGQI